MRATSSICTARSSRSKAPTRDLRASRPALRDFLAAWLLQPGAGARVHALLDERLAAAGR